MKKIILAPDSFKGTMSSQKICEIMEKVVKLHFNNATILKIPVADGGEGTVDCFLNASGGKIIEIPVKGPIFNSIHSFYGILADGKTAVIEMAAAAGLPLAGHEMDPAITTTYGVGQLIKHAIDTGCKKIILGLGGSCTNDGGAGMAAALGIRFLDQYGREFIPTGGTLNEITRIDISQKHKGIDHCVFEVICDVNNPLFGKDGAAYVFAPQKGANPDMVHVLDKNLMYFSELLIRDMGLDISMVPGAGAAGGLGAGAMAFLGAELKPGIEIILNALDFDTLLNKTDFIITGEGRIDNQSLRGKVILGIARRAKPKKIPVFAIAGDIDEGIEDIYQQGITAILSTNRAAIPFHESRKRCENDLALTVDTLMRILKLYR